MVRKKEARGKDSRVGARDADTAMLAQSARRARRDSPSKNPDGRSAMLKALAVAATIIFAATTGMATAADTAILKGFYSFGADQTIADIGKVEWQPLKLEGLPPGVEIAMLPR
jgi:hypothetical protein